MRDQGSDGAARKLRRVVKPLLLRVGTGEIVEGSRYARMVYAKRIFTNIECAPINRLRFRIAAAPFEDIGEVIVGGADV